MKIGTQKWSKEGTTVDMPVAVCECGGIMNQVGYAGCSHDNDYTYIYQCITCKLVSTTNNHIRSEDMEKYGWKKV